MTADETVGYIVVEIVNGDPRLTWDDEIHDVLANAMVDANQARLSDSGQYAVAKLVLTEPPRTQTELRAYLDGVEPCVPGCDPGDCACTP